MPVCIITCRFLPVDEMDDSSAFIVKILWEHVNFGQDDQTCFDIQDLLVHFDGEEGENVDDTADGGAAAGLATALNSSDDEDDADIIAARIRLGLTKRN